MSRLIHQNTIVWRKGIHNSRFPGSRSRRREHHYRAARLHNRPHVLQSFFYDGGEFSASVIHDRAVNRAQHAIRNIAWSGNLQEVAASMNGNLQAVRRCGKRLYTNKSERPDFAPKDARRSKYSASAEHTAPRDPRT